MEIIVFCKIPFQKTYLFDYVIFQLEITMMPQSDSLKDTEFPSEREQSDFIILSFLLDFSSCIYAT